MNVSLTVELEQYIARKVESGLYHSASEVVREGLRLLRERDEVHQQKLAELRKEIALGLDQADRGMVSTFDDRTLAEVQAEGRKRLAAEGRTRPKP
jgi:antitoxin ParD1/3/4